MKEPIRLGGMALANGVLVHGPRYYACAVREGDGPVLLAADEKPLRSTDVSSPFLRGPARIAEVFALLPAVKRALPEARLPFFEPRILATMAATGLSVRLLRGSRLGTLAQELLAAALGVVPVALALRGTTLAAYHGAEHIAIGSYEHGEPRPREHERCGSHMLGPLLVATIAGNAVANALGETARGKALARSAVAVASVGVAGEIFGWMQRHPSSPIARALAWPGHELQSRFLTAEPTEAQLEVAETALRECLRLEREHAEAERSEV